VQRAHDGLDDQDGRVRGSFAAFLTPPQDNAERIEEQIAAVRAAHLPTCGLSLGKQAVHVAVTLRNHNGGTAGMNTKTKRIMGQIHGRASFALLAYRILVGLHNALSPAEVHESRRVDRPLPSCRRRCDAPARRAQHERRSLPDSTVPTAEMGFGRCYTSPQYMLVLSRWLGGGSWGGLWGAVVASVTRFTAEAIEAAVRGYVHPRLDLLPVWSPAARFAAATASSRTTSRLARPAPGTLVCSVADLTIASSAYACTVSALMTAPGDDMVALARLTVDPSLDVVSELTDCLMPSRLPVTGGRRQ
jgi:hypothetical protein